VDHLNLPQTLLRLEATWFSFIDESKEGMETRATAIDGSLGGWLSERLRQETNLLAEPPNVSHLPESRNETR
jgi:hypothetical protein